MAPFPIFFVIAIAAGAGLLAVFALWVSKRIADEKTRTHGITIAAITVVVLMLGLFVTRSSVRPQPPSAVVAPSPTASISVESGDSIDSGGRIQFHAQHQEQPMVAHGAARLAWGPLTLAAVVVAVIVLAVTSRKGLAASLAGFGIVAAILVLYLSAAHDVRQVAEVSHRMATPAPTPPYYGVQESTPRPSAPPWAEKAAHEQTSTDHDAEAAVTTVEKAAAEDEKESHDNAPTVASKNPAPAWIKSEPTMEGGVYRAVVVSGPYSSKRECESNLDQPLRKALMEYARDHLSPNAQHHAWADIGYIRNNMVSKPDDAHWYLAEAEYGVGTMYNLYVQLTVDPQDAARFNQLARQSEIRRAVESTSVGGASVLALLAVLYGGLRFAGRKKPAAPVNGNPGVPAEATA